MVQNPHQRCGTTRRSRRASEGPESVGGAGGAGEHGRVLKTRARPRRPRAVGVAQANFARNFPRSFFETTQKRCNSNDTNSKFEILTGELRAKLLCDGRAGSTAVPVNYGAWPPCRWAVGVAQTNFARNFPRSFFETTQKRCNSNDTNSRFELLAGELRAKLLIDSHNWATCNKTQEGAAHRHTQRPGPKAGPAAHRHTQQPGPKAGPDGAPQDRHTSGATSRPSSAGN